MFRPIIVIEHAAAVHCNAICWYFRAACCKALPPADGAAVPPSVQRVECNLAATSSHALTHSIVNPLMSTHPNLLFVPHSALHRCARTQTQTNKNTHRQQKTNTKRQHWYFFWKCVFWSRVEGTGRLQWAWKRRLIISWIKPRAPSLPLTERKWKSGDRAG